MGTYVNVVSTIKPVDKIRTFIGGVATDITSAWTFVNGVRKQIFPTTEEWVLINTLTPGSYSETLGFGKYKIVYSGGGGGGAATSCYNEGTRTAGSGSAGEEYTYYFDIGFGETETLSGVVGAGGTGGYAYGKHATGTAGTGGSGYASGGNGTKAGNTSSFPYMTAGGGGGGSTSLMIDSILQTIAKGGNGGTGHIRRNSASQHYYGYGGTGGSGGTSSGTGAGGGAGALSASSSSGNAVTGGSGADGYVKIYKSNFYPA